MTTTGVPVLPLDHGTLSVEGEVVIARLRNQHVNKDIVVPLAEAELRLQGRYMDILRNGEAVEGVLLPKKLGPVKEFLAAFAEAKAQAVSRAPAPAGVAVGRCGHCGAPGKRADQTCRFCGF